MMFRRSPVISKNNDVLNLSLEELYLVGVTFALLLLSGLPITHAIYLTIPVYLSCICYNANNGVFGCHLKNFFINWCINSLPHSEKRRAAVRFSLYWLLVAFSVGMFCIYDDWMVQMRCCVCFFFLCKTEVSSVLDVFLQLGFFLLLWRRLFIDQSCRSNFFSWV